MSAAGELNLQVSKDAMSAVLSIPPGFDPRWLSRDLCEATLEAHQLVLPAPMRQRLDEAIERHRAEPDAGQKVPIEGVAPRHGKDGELTLTVGPEDTPAQDASGAVSTVDHYAVCPFTLVEPGQVIGHISEPEPGEDGVDLRGKIAAARPGKPVNLKLDDTILLDAKGQLIAQVSGALEHQGHKLKINRVLAVERFVDFETGNIHFDGDVEVQKGVRDCFEVNARGSAVIRGLVEGATLRTGADLTLAGGMAAKEKGVLHVGRDCRAKYLDHVEGRIAHDLHAEREIINCKLEIHGQLVAPHGELIGGQLHTLRHACLKELGSEAGVRTVLCLGSAPAFDRVLDAAEQRVLELESRAEQLQKQIDTIQNGSRTMATSTKEQITELMCEQMEARESLESITERRDKLKTYYNRMRHPAVEVLGTVHPGAVVVLGQSAATFRDPQRGPLTITADKHGELCIRLGANGELRSIRSVAELSLHNPDAPTRQRSAA